MNDPTSRSSRTNRSIRAGLVLPGCRRHPKAAIATNDDERSRARSKPRRAGPARRPMRDLAMTTLRMSLTAVRCGAVVAGCLGLPAVAAAAALPTQLGACSETQISALGSRLEGAPDSGSAVSYANGGYQVSYDLVQALQRSKVGDPIKLCLIQLPTGCPKGDDRGKVYKG